jgi:hypothetical protein
MTTLTWLPFASRNNRTRGLPCSWQVGDIVCHCGPVSWPDAEHGNGLHPLSPGGGVGVAKEEVPFPRAQYASNMLSAEEISAVLPEHEYFADVLMIWLTRSEFWFLEHAQEASEGASVGQASQVWTICQLQESFAKHQ